ncbi:hypothetical protein IHQ68_03890 [Chelatococcus sambhunathii]|uniref:FG-GAP repeat n=1 Tax=Chelatococcus sambhunathii TaxID=363953 RepID=A0ABU1DCW6_9HYPH|nr:hypothetical protein [Chelatococcus sambhunathii]MDR4305765.1 hypothetical protein [Chelatococcus sambhunathii]
MLLFLAAAATTLVVTTTEDVVDAKDGKLSLREAIIEANDSGKPVVIAFGKTGVGFHGMKSALDIHPKQPLTVKGDVDDDGQSDVVLNNGFDTKAVIGAGSAVTFVGVDFFYGSGAGEPGQSGATGADGMQGLAGKDGTKTNTTVTTPTNGGPGGAGKPGTNGTAGENAAGIIRNYGKLTLVRLGLSNGYAIAGSGGSGGAGGWGGFGGSGGKGIGASPGDVYVDNPVVQDGANGAAAGDGADGGDGGDGGHAAGAILNEASGEVHLVDVAFGGRLGGYLVGRGSTAIAGRGALRGPGGDGRRGGLGGVGGSALYEVSIAATFVWKPNPSSSVTDYWFRYTPTRTGAGGAGANGGRRGADGKIGAGGSAASALLNLGAAEGRAAIGAVGKATPATATTIGVTPYTNGQGGTGGSYGAGRVKTFSFCPGIEARNDPSFTAEAMKHKPGDYRLDFPANNGVTPPTQTGPSGLAGADGVRTTAGAAGVGKDGVLNADGGAGSVETAGSLVFVHPLGVQKSKKEDTLDFNVIRLGKGDGPVTVAWKIEEAKKGASVEPRVFGKAKFPSGKVKFAKIPADAQTDIDNSVKRVSLPVNLSKIGKKAEGYRIVIAVKSGADVIAGTDEVAGKIEGD